MHPEDLMTHSPINIGNTVKIAFPSGRESVVTIVGERNGRLLFDDGMHAHDPGVYIMSEGKLYTLREWPHGLEKQS